MTHFSDLEQNYTPYLPQDKSANILDIGCGRGRILSFLKEKGYTNILGIDIDQSELKHVPLSIKTEHIHDLKAFLSAHQNQYDLIIAKDVLYYLNPHELEEYLSLIRKCLKPRSKIIAEVFNAAAVSSRYTQYKDLGIRFTFTEISLRKSLERAGFKVTALFNQKNNKCSPKYLLYRFLQLVWFNILKLIYILERGIDQNNPKLFAKSIIATGERLE